MALGTIGTDPDYSSLLAQRSDPRLLMAQKLMELDKPPTNNSSKSSFWANLLAQGARGGLGGYLYNDVQADREKERVAQEAEAKAFRERMERGPPGGTGTAPAQPSVSPAPQPNGSVGPAQRGSSGNAAAGALPPEQQQAIVAAATQGTMVPPDLAHAVITQESGWKPGAQGKGSDTGLGQVTNSTAADPGYGLPPLSEADRLDPQKNATWAMRYLEARGKAAGLTRPEDWQNPAKVALALKAYNGGGDPNYVANVTRHLRTSDAGDAGSNMEALLSGVDAPKPRGMQLAERVALGGGETATDSPTPILSAPVVPVASAALQGVAGPQPPSADVPQPSPTESGSVPPAATAPPPDLAPPIPAPPLPGADDPYVNQADVPPAPAPNPILGNNAAPLQANALPPSPLANADPATLASVNGAPAPDAATVPQPEAAVVPPPNAATVPAAQPPVPPGLLAQRLQQSAPAPAQDNATEALNTASLAAARGTPGQQLAAPLMSWAGNLGADGAPLLTPASGPTGPQLAAPLVTPASATGDPGGFGGQSKAPQAPAPAPQADDQAKADWYLSLAREAAGSSNPKIRANASTLEAQGMALQRRVDHQETAAGQAQTRQDNLDLRRQVADAAAASREETAADRKERTRIENERLNLERDKSEQGRLQPGYTWADEKHNNQVPIPGGPADPKTLRDKARTDTDKVLAERGYEPDPDKPGAYRKIEGGPAADKGAAKKPGDGVVKGVTGNIQLLNQIDDSIAAVRANPNAFGMTNYIPGADRFGTPEEQAARARVAAMSNAEIHDLSGSAVGAKEDQRMQQAIPYVTQNKDQVLARLQEMRRVASQRLQQAYDVYNPDNGYQAIPGHARAIGMEEGSTATERAGVRIVPGGGGAPVRISGDEEFDKLKPGQQFIGPDGKVRTK